MKIGCWLLITAFTMSAARAQNEIVFAARFYYPPARNPAKVSHSHLYTIGPNGKGRTQITTGSGDDSDPHWSPEGNRVLFTRSLSRIRDNWEVAIVDLRGGRSKAPIILRHFTEEMPSAAWSSNGKQVIVTVDAAEKTSRLLFDARTGRLLAPAQTVPRDSPLINAVDVFDDEGSTLAPMTLDISDDQHYVLVLGGVSGGEGKRIPIRFSAESAAIAGSLGGGLRPVPLDKRFVLAATMEGNSTEGHWHKYIRINTETGEATSYAEGKFLSWSPNAKQFVTVAGRDLAAYGKPLKGRPDPRYVWVSPLLIGNAATGKTTAFVSGLVWVTSAKWRPRASPLHS